MNAVSAIRILKKGRPTLNNIIDFVQCISSINVTRNMDLNKKINKKQNCGGCAATLTSISIGINGNNERVQMLTDAQVNGFRACYHVLEN